MADDYVDVKKFGELGKSFGTHLKKVGKDKVDTSDEEFMKRALAEDDEDLLAAREKCTKKWAAYPPVTLSLTLCFHVQKRHFSLYTTCTLD